MLESLAASILFAGGLFFCRGIPMSRLTQPAWLLLTLALGAGIPAPAYCQAAVQLPPADGPDPVADSSENRELARAKFEAVHADPRELRRQLLQAARDAYRAQYEEFLAGRGSIEGLWQASLPLVEAELIVQDRPEAQAAALEAGWERAWATWQVSSRRFAAGRVSVADHAETDYHRLEAESRWLRALARADKGRGTRTLLPRVGPDDLSATDLDPANDFRKDLAEAKRTALHTDPREVDRQKAAVARTWYRAQMEEYLAGRGTLFIILEAVLSLADAEAAVADRPEDWVAAFEAGWARTWLIDQIGESRFAAGRVSVADHLAARGARLAAQARWLRARGRAGEVRERNPGGREILQADELGVAGLDTRAFTRAKREALRTDPRDLERERRTVAREEFRAQNAEFLAGRGTLDLLLAASRHWLDADLAMLDRPAERAAAHERYWTRIRLIEEVTDARFEAGRVAVADWAETRGVRLEAEIRWAEARERAAQEKK